MKQSDFYKNKAWRYLSKIVLLTYCDDNGEVSCATCGSKKHVRDKLMHCGHWIKSNNRSTALEFTNCAPQCYKCNIKYNRDKKSIASFRLLIVIIVFHLNVSSYFLVSEETLSRMYARNYLCFYIIIKQLLTGLSHFKYNFRDFVNYEIS